MKKITRTSKEYISKLSNFLSAIDVTHDEFMRIKNTDIADLYTEKIIKKKDGSNRTVFSPSSELKIIQKKIKNRFLSVKDGFFWPDYIYGSIKKTKNADQSVNSRDYVACANRHSGAKSLLTVDIKNFFDNVHEDLVNEVLMHFFTVDQEVASAIITLCCRNGSLVQGAPTSSYLANLCLFNIEPTLVEQASTKKPYLHKTC